MKNETRNTKQTEKQPKKLTKPAWIAIGIAAALILSFIILLTQTYLFDNLKWDGKERTLEYSYGTYVGLTHNGLPNGQGTLLMNNGDVYEGEFRDGTLNGEGRVTTAGGSILEGEFKNGQLNGTGMAVTADGDVMEGSFVNGLQEGEGTLTHPSGSVYSGSFKGGKMDGEGVYVFANGTTYEGDFKGNAFSGTGKMTYTDGTVIEGDFADSKPNGQITKTYANGDVFTGNCADGVISGDGQLQYADGSFYEGTFAYGMPEGEGSYTSADGAFYSGEFKGGIASGTGVLQNEDGTATYTGEVENGLANGQGKIEFSNGAEYNGSMLDGAMYGEGVLTDGSDWGTLTGIFAEDPDSYTLAFKGNIDCDSVDAFIADMVWTGETRYAGNLDNGLIAGNAVINYTDGDKYDGSFVIEDDETNFVGTLVTGDVAFEGAGKHGRTGIFNLGSYTEAVGTAVDADGMSCTGVFKNGKPVGEATCAMPNGFEVNGVWEDEVFSGTGTFETDGASCECDYANLVRGQCVCTDEYGTYEGPVDDSGAYSGDGIYTDADGAVYAGTFADGHFTAGTMTAVSGDSFVGTWDADGRFSGTGTKSVENGIYEGEFVNDLYQGRGMFTFTTGEVYEGDFSEGTFDGNGTMTYPNGDVYSGTYEAGLRSGAGRYDGEDGWYYDGAWADDKMNGKGTLDYNDGSVYVGNFVDSKESGEGVLTWKNGASLSGTFDDVEHCEGTLKDQSDWGTLNGTFVLSENTLSFIGSVETDKFESMTGDFVWIGTEPYAGNLDSGEINGKMEIVADELNRFSGDYRISGTTTTLTGDFELDGANANGTAVVKEVGLFKMFRTYEFTGTVNYPNGSKYIGTIVDGKKGAGSFILADGNVVTGDFDKDGCFVGTGSASIDGAQDITCECRYLDGEPQGCSCDLPGDGLYTGIVKDGRFEGTGVVNFPGCYSEVSFTDGVVSSAKTNFDNGDRYEGGLCVAGDAFAAQGEGKYYWADGSSYNGSWVNDKRDGKGVFCSADGFIYDGEWKEDLYDGEGTLSSEAWGVYEGHFTAGEINGYGRFTAPNGDIYEGEWKNGVREGEGRSTDERGVYEGGWKNDVRDGKGTMTYADGTVESGIWLRDVYMGADR